MEEQPGFVSLRVATPSVLKVLNRDKMSLVVKKNEQLNQIFTKYVFKIKSESKTKSVPLDYIMVLP